jgi:hypothetical protein
MKMRPPMRSAGRAPVGKVVRGGDVTREEGLWLGNAEDDDRDDFEDDDFDDDDEYDEDTGDFEDDDDDEDEEDEPE